jgi:hypothetical protein
MSTPLLPPPALSVRSRPATSRQNRVWFATSPARTARSWPVTSKSSPYRSSSTALNVSILAPGLPRLIDSKQLTEAALQRPQRGEEAVETGGGGCESEVHGRVHQSGISRETNGQLTTEFRGIPERAVTRSCQWMAVSTTFQVLRLGVRRWTRWPLRLRQTVRIS